MNLYGSRPKFKVLKMHFKKKTLRKKNICNLKLGRDSFDKTAEAKSIKPVSK